MSSFSRCPWVGESREYLAYHDEEWGRPVTDSDRIYEKLCLESFQSGLSWLTILRKRPAFRAAFGGFDPRLVAAFGPADVSRLLADAGIVRNRAKIEATIANARATVAMAEEGESLAGLVWSFEPSGSGAGPPVALSGLPSVTPEATSLAKALKARGFRFLGPTTVYATMQSLGVVNDHVVTCFARTECEKMRRNLSL